VSTLKNDGTRLELADFVDWWLELADFVDWWLELADGVDLSEFPLLPVFARDGGKNELARLPIGEASRDRGPSTSS
jgi:hypothetical protein